MDSPHHRLGSPPPHLVTSVPDALPLDMNARHVVGDSLVMQHHLRVLSFGSFPDTRKLFGGMLTLTLVDLVYFETSV